MSSPGVSPWTFHGPVSGALFNSGAGTANQYNGWPPRGPPHSDNPTSLAQKENTTLNPSPIPQSDGSAPLRDTAPQALPHVQDETPLTQISTPPAQVGTPPAKVATPPAHAPTPSAQDATPPAQVTTPPAQVAASPAHDATPTPSAAGSLRASTTVPSQVKYGFGFILPLVAGSSLNERVKATIGEKLVKERRFLKKGRWALRTAFMHGRDDFRNLMKGEQYGRHNQIILITVNNPNTLEAKAMEELPLVLGGIVKHYGLLRLGESMERVITPVELPAYDESEETFRKDFGHGVKEDELEVVGRPGEEFRVRFNGTDRWPSGHAATPTYYTATMSVQHDKSQSIKWGELQVNGPEGYVLSKVDVRVSAEARPYWDITQPAGRSMVDHSAPFTETNAATIKNSTTTTAGIEVTENGFKGSLSVATMDGRDMSRSTSIIRNGLAIHHHMDGVGRVTVTYSPQLRTNTLAVPTKDLPMFSMYPENNGPQMGTITIKTVASWTLKGGLDAKNEGSWGKRGIVKMPESAPEEDVLYCTELTIPWDAHGRCTVPP